MTPEPMHNPPCVPCRSSFGFHHSFGVRISSFVILAGALLAAGCFSPRPDFYVLRGRVLDADTGQGIAQARLRLRAAVATNLGPKVFSAYGITAPDGSYELELAEGYDALRLAGRIRLDAGKTGYATGGADIPSPARKQKAYAAPDVLLQRLKPGNESPGQKGDGSLLPERPFGCSAQKTPVPFLAFPPHAPNSRPSSTIAR